MKFYKYNEVKGERYNAPILQHFLKIVDTEGLTLNLVEETTLRR